MGQRIIRFDSVGGASGDMLLGALSGLGGDLGKMTSEIAKMLPEKVIISCLPHSDFGIAGVQAQVELEHHHHHHHNHGHHHHRSWRDIKEMIEKSSLPDAVKDLSIRTFTILAEAEGQIHGKSPEEVTFHEVGATDSIADIIGANYLYWDLKIDGISLSSLPTGSGTVECAHGIYPVPAPATAVILQKGNLTNHPCDDEASELVTPTGAALLVSWTKKEIAGTSSLRATANSFGHRKLKTRPNLLRALLYETEEEGNLAAVIEPMILLESNIDDASPELVADLAQKLRENGALDVWQSAIVMKKGRLGVLLTLLCRTADKAANLDILWCSGLTLGVREMVVSRHHLSRRSEKFASSFGEVTIKIAEYRGKNVSVKPEYEDCKALAAKHGLPLKKIIDKIITELKYE